MSSFSARVERLFRTILPSPFSIAIMLSVLCFAFILIFQKPDGIDVGSYTLELIDIWSNGIWSQGGLVFLVQMMLMLILGHVLALTPGVHRAIGFITKLPKNGSQAAAVTALATMLVSFFNWGLGLIFGAVLAKSMHQQLSKNKIAHNYPLLAACGYVGLMVWHGGLSGSSLIKVAEPGHLASFATEGTVPNVLGIDQTVFSLPNMLCWLILLIAIPFFVYRFGENNSTQITASNEDEDLQASENAEAIYLAEKVESHRWYSVFLGLGFIALLLIGLKEDGWGSLFTPNKLNYLLLSLCLLFAENLNAFFHKLNIAMKDGAGILIQFPLYFGIMALMKDSGFAATMAQYFASNSSETIFPFMTFISSGIINIFIPSGGGQWLVQAPILVESCLALNIPLEKGIMALAYGDQLTNMLQPFWALPLLGITGLKAQKIFPYTMMLFVLGFIIFGATILLW